MCMINEAVNRVSDTKLFASFDNNKKKQIMIYSNEIDNKYPSNAMVLPVPNPKSVKFHSMKECSDFFSQLDKNFVEVNAMLGARSKSYNFSDSLNDVKQSLQIHDVGSYLVSIVESYADFDRLDKSVFRLTDGIKDILKTKYSATFGFLVCKLKVGTRQYEPLAYSHNSLTKHSRPYLFVPTYHYHPHGSFGGLNSYYNNHTDDNTYADDWSHDIYIINLNPSSDFNSYIKKLDSFGSWVYQKNPNTRVGYNKLNFDLPNNLQNYQKLHVEGRRINTDLVVDVY